MKKIIFISILIIAMLCSCANDVMLKFFDKMDDNAYVELGIYSPDVSAAEDLADIATLGDTLTDEILKLSYTGVTGQMTWTADGNTDKLASAMIIKEQADGSYKAVLN